MAPQLMRLALRNLLSNALKFSPAGSLVVVRLADSEEPLALLIDVIDQGPGIPDGLLPHLFDKRIRHVLNACAPDARPSGGLGLHLVKQAMQHQKGRAELLSTGAQGSVLRLCLVQG